ncbi:MAG: threonine ammonia-lyase [Alphaproteobacteria bacterium]|nr:threonine ammonia-lyase [Alphaproteobacteria bacterium]MBU6473703.1 threonine ammonia-lyase [Alphaproteobacteria bacterium]MDE2013752.1 threonine ammonia-lyase [Alphaproteobacteria bacterium]MDE2075418.1 threonine ammonia-lyase [Alphaproteobacteria bacterium]
MSDTATFSEVSIDDVRAAAEVIRDAVERTPTHYSRTLSKIAGCEVYLKFENLQFTASFKERGALNKLTSLSAEERARGVVAMSAGNHAQGVAYHAGRLGIPATIVMPEGTPFNKVKHTKGFGARVVLEGATLAQASAKARALAAEENLAFVHPYDDPKIIAGQGTVALELLADVPDVDTLVVPIGGGGLISGIAVAAKALKPSIDIYGVQAKLYPSMYDVVKQADLPCSGQTIAEGIAVKEPGGLTRRIVSALVKDVLLVREDEIEKSIASLLEIEKTVVEGAGAAAFAAVAANTQLFSGKKVGLILSGGNIDMRLLSNVILRELSREGRILSLLVEIQDQPGQLAKIATLVGEAGGNILEVSHNRMITDMSAKLADLGMTIEARDAGHAAEIRKKLVDAGFNIRASSQNNGR